MGYAIATVDNSGGIKAFHKVLAAIKTLAEANGWVTQRYVDTGEDRELILKSQGLSGTEEIFTGFKCYSSVTGDYYNIAAATMVGYVAGNSFETQPGISMSGVPCHNNAVTFFMIANEQRIAGVFKVGTPVYCHFYVGKYFGYARPGEFPAPLIAAGMFDGKALTRFSDTTQSMPYKVNGAAPHNLRLRTQAGVWVQPRSWPWRDGENASDQRLAGVHTSVNSYQRCLVAYNGQYAPLPIILFDATPNTYGELDGVYFVTGFNNGVENVLQVGGTPVDQAGMSVLDAVEAVLAAGGRAFVVLQDVYRTSWRDFIALEMK